MHDAGAASSQPVGSSVCDVCQGICDMSNPRGFITPEPDHKITHNKQKGYKYRYTYIHHADLKALFASADAGCTICQVIGDRFGERAMEAARGGSEDMDQTVANESAQPNSGAHTVQSDEDVVTAIELAELAGREQLYSANDLSVHGPGRIIVQWSCKNKSDLAGTAAADLYAYILNPATAASTCFEDSASSTCSEESADFFCSLPCLITPGMSNLETSSVSKHSTNSEQGTQLTQTWNIGLPKTFYQKLISI